MSARLKLSAPSSSSALDPRRLGPSQRLVDSSSPILEHGTKQCTPKRNGDCPLKQHSPVPRFGDIEVHRLLKPCPAGYCAVYVQWRRTKPVGSRCFIFQQPSSPFLIPVNLNIR